MDKRCNRANSKNSIWTLKHDWVMRLSMGVLKAERQPPSKLDPTHTHRHLKIPNIVSVSKGLAKKTRSSE
jgi:hypothetical protein